MFAVLGVKNLLFVSIAFPPKNDPECIQTARYFYYLNQTKQFNVTVVTSKRPTLYMPEDTSLQKYGTDSKDFMEISIIENRYLNYFLRKIGLGKFLFPDSKMNFHWQWKRVVQRLKYKPDVIYSRSNPMSSAFMARKLKRHYKCPWIMHLSDPWALSPLHQFSEKDRIHYLATEQSIIAEADVITFTTEQTKALYQLQYPKEANKFHVFPNVYDPQEITSHPKPMDKKLRIVYTGGLGGKRSVFFLEEVLNLLRSRLPAYHEKIEFIFAGDVDRKNKQFFGKDLAGIKHVGLLSYADAKELCQTARLLLVVDNPTKPTDAIYFPSKVLDYFLSKRKIWAVTPQNSATRDVLVGYPHAAFEHTDIEAMVQFLLRSVEELKTDGAYFQVNNLPERFSAQQNAEKLAQLISGVVRS
jgi:glycosyltransferase involved in cell wall biosynthesis